MIDYIITRSDRKTVAIYVHKDGQVDVRCPKRVSDSTVEELVSSKQKWIEEMVEKTIEKFEKRQAFYINKDSFLTLLGKKYPIKNSLNKKVTFDNKHFNVPLSLSEEDIKQSVIMLYKKMAKEYLSKSVNEYARIMQVCPKKIKINSAKTRWGSCSGKNNINFSWRLIMADEKTVDYVIIHELAHITEHNHSTRFWAIVKKYMPDYKQQEKSLKQLHEKLGTEDWE